MSQNFYIKSPLTFRLFRHILYSVHIRMHIYLYGLVLVSTGALKMEKL